MYEKLQTLNLNTLLISKWMSERPYVWQMSLLTEKKFLDFSKAKGVDFGLFEDDVKKLRKLWKLGFIKADLIISENDLTEDGIEFLRKNEFAENLYADERNFLERKDGYVNSLAETEDVSQDIKLLFHPFRLFILHKIREIAELNLHPLLLYSSSKVYKEWVDSHIKLFDGFSSGENFLDNFICWNEIVSLAVAAEPLIFNQIFGFHSIHNIYPFTPNEENREIFYKSMNTHLNEFKEFLKDVDIDEAKEVIAELCREVEIIEPNGDVLKLLRLTKGNFRLDKLKGNLGLSINILTIAETIRRSLEIAFGVEIQEEDQLGFSWGKGSFKKNYYGSERLLDNKKAKVEFLRDLGLDYNVRLRWYVEGKTEFGALQSELGNNIAIEIINLNGEIAAGKRRGAAFGDNLLIDMNRSIYSWILIDRDKEKISDNCRVVSKAAEKDEMFGSYFFSNPDIEFENFTLDELVEIAWEKALEDGANVNEKEALIEATKSAQTGKEFEELARKSIPSLYQFSKGEDWGVRLMKFAKANRKMQKKDGSYKVRQICESIILALHAVKCNYYLSKKDCKVDIATGKLINCK